MRWGIENKLKKNIYIRSSWKVFRNIFEFAEKPLRILHFFSVRVIWAHVRTSFSLLWYCSREGLILTSSSDFTPPAHSCSSAQSLCNNPCDKTVAQVPRFCFLEVKRCQYSRILSKDDSGTGFTLEIAENATKSQSCDSE